VSRINNDLEARPNIVSAENKNNTIVGARCGHDMRPSVQLPSVSGVDSELDHRTGLDYSRHALLTRWQVTLWDPMWQVTLRSSVMDLSIKSYTYLYLFTIVRSLAPGDDVDL